MNDFKIEYNPSYGMFKYEIYRKEYKWLGLNWNWKELASFESLELAETSLLELKKFPKYYDIRKCDNE